MTASTVGDHWLVGRKVYFVAPPSRVAQELVPELLHREYEVAVLEDHTRVRDLFRLHPGSIVYLYIDAGYFEPEWEEIVREAGTLPENERPRIGILTSGTDPEVMHKYILEFEVPCGCLKWTGDREELTATVVKVLEANNAKGRRQFLRVPCPAGTAALNYLEDDHPRSGTILDISSVGMACTFDEEPGFIARSLVTGIQLKLKGILCQVSAVVMGTRPRDQGPPVYVLLFDPKTPDETREKIRSFIGRTLQAILETEFTSLGA